MKKTYKLWLTAMLVGLLAGPMTPVIFGAASGNYTDLLPVGAAANTTVISNGSGWSLTTVAPSQTFGDALSRAPMTVYQSTSAATFNTTVAVTTMTAISAQGFVGSTTFPFSWLAAGRSIRFTIRGNYGTTGSPTWNWGINIGTTTILSTGALGAPTTVTSKPFVATGIITVAGSDGSVNASYDVFVTTSAGASSLSNVVSYSTATAKETSVTFSNALSINPIFTWGTSNSANTVTVNNATVEFLN